MNLLVNKKASFNYDIFEKFEAGIQLVGSEVKSLRKKHGSIKESYVTVDTEVFLKNVHIPLYQAGHTMYKGFDPYQNRKLLLSKKEIKKIKEALKQKGYTIIPLKIYTKGSYIKIEIALARGKKKFDKRNSMKKQTAKREVERAMKKL